MKIFESHSLLKESGHIFPCFFGIFSGTTNVKKNVSFRYFDGGYYKLLNFRNLNMEFYV
jgi:hypothetical protein